MQTGKSKSEMQKINRSASHTGKKAVRMLDQSVKIYCFIRNQTQLDDNSGSRSLNVNCGCLCIYAWQLVGLALLTFLNIHMQLYIALHMV